MAGKIEIDAAHPLGSLTAGPQQFTMAADTNHRHSAIFGVVAADIPEMARNGVRHIMLEFSQEPMSELTRRYPGLAAATTWDERRDVLDQEEQRLYDRRQVYIQEALRTRGDDPDTDRWNAIINDAMHRADEELGIAQEQLLRARMDLESHELIEGVFSKPPKFTDEEIRQRSQSFIPPDSDDPQAAANNFADILINSRNHGLQVHLTGDRAPVEMTVALDQADRELREFNEANDHYVQLNQRLTTERGFAIPPGDLDSFRAFLNEAVRLTNRLNDAMQATLDIRDDPAYEQRRVDRMIAAANGERAVVVWGAAHAFKPNDFNEMFDARLRAQAEAAGRPTPAPTLVLELTRSREAHAERNLTGRAQDPHARVYIEEREVEILPPGEALLTRKPVSPAPAPVPQIPVGQTPGQAEYAALMERLMSPVPAPAAPQSERKIPPPLVKPEFSP